MKEGIVISVLWRLLKGSMLATLPILGVEDPRAFYKKARSIYLRALVPTNLPGEHRLVGSAEPPAVR